MLIAWIQILVGLGCLVYGADRFVTGAAQTARFIGMPPLIIGLTVVGMATSAPEILVGSVAAINGKTSIAIGNALGSNIANIGLVLGGTALFSPLLIKSRTIRREFTVMVVALVIALLLLADLNLGRIDGILLLLSLICAIVWIIHMSGKSLPDDPLAKEFSDEIRSTLPLRKSLFYLVFGLVILLGGAEILVRGSVFIAESLGISDLVIGLTIIAVGTSLPELSTSVMSVIKGEADIAIGNVIGSNMFNILAVLGVPALINPESFEADVLTRDYLIMVLLTLVMGWMLFSKGKGTIDRIEGSVLLLAFIGYQAWLFNPVSI